MHGNVSAVGRLLFAVGWLAGTASAEEPCQKYEVEYQVAFPTDDWQIVEHRDGCPGGNNYFMMRKGQTTRTLRTVKEFVALLPPVRNEIEALALATFLSAKVGYWAGTACWLPESQPTPTPASQGPSQEPRKPSVSTEKVRLVDATGAVQDVDAFAIAVSRLNATGPFVVERYQRCPENGGRLALVRETFGGKPPYAREILSAVGEAKR